MCKEENIPHSAVPEWYDLGIALGMDPGVLDSIDTDYAKRRVVKCCKDMLKFWWKETEDAKRKELLITAVDKSGDKTYAQRMKGEH